jgi:hypothetical protein
LRGKKKRDKGKGRKLETERWSLKRMDGIFTCLSMLNRREREGGGGGTKNCFSTLNNPTDILAGCIKKTFIFTQPKVYSFYTKISLIFGNKCNNEMLIIDPLQKMFR